MPSEVDSLDGPAPKALPEDTSEIGEDGMPLNPSGGLGVQFIPQGKDPNNGDAKVELGDVGGPPKFVGLGKEELMKYANDPFWVRLRWILFILFWILWVAMLAGAIVIIILAPKCSGTSQVTSEVVKDGPYYQVFLKAFTPNQNKFEGLDEKADYIKSLGVKTVIISQFMDTANFEAIDPAYGVPENQTFKDLVASLKTKGLKVILQIIPNHSSKKNKWFTESPDFYVLKKTDEVNNSSWSTWTPIEGTDKSYLHQFDEAQPDLNFQNKDLIKEMNKVFKYWYKSADISGFLISDVSYLLEDQSDLSNQNNTINQEGNKKVLEELLDSSTWDLGERSPPYALLDVDGLNTTEAQRLYSSQRMMPISSDLSTGLTSAFTAIDLKNQVEGINSKKFVLRRLSSPRLQPITAKFGNERASILEMVTFLLRGEVVVYYGEEVGLTSTFASGKDKNVNVGQMQFSANPDQDPNLVFFKKLVDFHDRLNQTVENTEEEMKFYVADGVFAFKRGNHILVANLDKVDRSIDLTLAFDVKDNGGVSVATPTPPRDTPLLLSPTFTLKPLEGYILVYGIA